jgi:hypothetical protein
VSITQPGQGDAVVTGTQDVLAVAPGFVQQAQGAPAPVRDALVAALDGVHERYQELTGYAAAQCDVLRATDQYLVGLAEDRGYFQQPGEAQEPFRSRVLGVPSQVTPAAIVAAVNAILAPLTSVQCQYLESVLDRVYLTDGTATFHSFFNGLAGAAPGDTSPQYPDRFYRDDALSGGLNTQAVPNRDPGGAWSFSDEIGRYFVLRVPVVADTTTTLAYPGLAPLSGIGSITNGTAVLALDGHSVNTFVAGDTGTPIVVVGAGMAGANLVTTILSWQSALSVTLAANALTTVPPGPVNTYWGRPILQGPNDTVAAELGGAEAGAFETNGQVIAEPVPTGNNLATTAGGRGLFLGDGSNTSGAEADGSVATFLFTGAQSALSTYQGMVNAVERIKGQSMRWQLLVDPNLIA